MNFSILPGQSYPLGATVYPDGVNFSLFSQHAEKIDLLLFAAPNDPQPARILTLTPEQNRTYYYWHVFVQGLKAGQVYAYRAYGPDLPQKGLRFDPSKVLLAPYAQAIVGYSIYDRQAAIEPGRDNCAKAWRGVVVAPRIYDWEGDRPLRHFVKGDAGMVGTLAARTGQTHLIFRMLIGQRFQPLFSFVTRKCNPCWARVTGFRCVCPA